MQQYRHLLPEDCYTELATKTDGGYTGADIQKICKKAWIRCKNNVLVAKRFMKVV